MQLSIPPAVLTANHDVRNALQLAQANTAVAQARLADAAHVPAGTKHLVLDALAAARDAVEGVDALGKANLLDGTFQRYASHSVRHLERAAELVSRPGRLSRDAMSLLADTIFDAEVATRLGTAAGDRSLAAPSPRAIERATEFAGGGDAGGGGPVWVDGEWLDGLGNPVRGGGDSSTGPDGESFGPDGEPVRGGGDEYVGPDGEGFSGI